MDQREPLLGLRVVVQVVAEKILVGERVDTATQYEESYEELRQHALRPDRGESRASEKFECLSPPLLKGNQAVPDAYLNQKESF
jgi:hypothetical protein